MIDRTAGIVLHNIKYSDSGVVTHLYTEKYGRMPVMIKGTGNRKAGRHRAYLQPLSVIEALLYYKETREMQTVKEFSAVYIPAGIYGDLVKTPVAMFLGEVLATVLREETAQKDLFSFIFEAIRHFDTCRSGVLNFHIGFLAGLCSYLGIEPAKRTEPGNNVFDFLNGSFVAIPPSHGNYAGTEISEILARVFSSSWESLNGIPMTGRTRNEVLGALLKYYAVHFPSLKKINSLEVLGKVFQGGNP